MFLLIPCLCHFCHQGTHPLGQNVINNSLFYDWSRSKYALDNFVQTGLSQLSNPLTLLGAACGSLTVDIAKWFLLLCSAEGVPKENGIGAITETKRFPAIKGVFSY